MAVNADQRDGGLAGSADLIKKLSVLAALDGRKIVRGAVRAGMNETKKLAQQRIHVGKRMHFTYKGRLVQPGFGKANITIVTTQKHDDGRIAALLGVHREAFYQTQFLERGTSKMRAFPWLRSSFYDSKDEQERAMVAYLNHWLLKVSATGAA